jgi:DNA polymerase-1
MTSSGEPTAGTYGFTSVILRLLEQDQPEYLAVSFDTGRTFRDDLYPDYKATREKMPDDLRLQIDRMREIVEAFGIPILEADGYEADDVLGTVAKQAAGQDVEVVILTGDRDLLQLVEENIRIRLAGQRLADAKDFGPEDVEAKYQLQPDQLVDLKALVGDSSDNIPGVRGVGEKTATTLLQEYKDLEGIYQHLDAVPTRFRSKLEEGEADANLSRELGQIVTDVPITFELAACRTQAYTRDEIVKLFRELEFRSLLDRLEQLAERDQSTQLNLFSGESEPRQYGLEVVIVDTPEALAEITQELEAAKLIAFDVETTDTDALKAELVGLSLATQPGRGVYIPTGHHKQTAGGNQLDFELIQDMLRKPLTDPTIPKVGHNLKYDYTMLARLGLQVKPLSFDTMVAEWLCNPASRNLGLKHLAWVRLGIEMTEIEELIGSGSKQRSMAEVSITDVAPYAAADAEVCLRLKDLLEQELGEKQQEPLFHDLEMPLVAILAEMEMEGIRLDVEFLDGFSTTLSHRLEEISHGIYREAGHEFNVNSTQQLSTVLFEELGIHPPDRTRKTSSGHYSTAAAVLDSIRDLHPIVDMVLEQREVAKLKSTYTDALPKQVNVHTGRVHTSFSQTGSVTGRLASSNPNLQNIPIRTDLGRQIRRAFVSSPGNLLLGVDYSQIELRIVAHMSEDRAMLAAFQEDQDIHAATAAAVFGVKPDEVTPDMRRRAKAVNFGLIYGMSAFGLTRTTDLTLGEAEEFVQTYFENFPGVKQYLERTKVQATELGYVETLLGRRRYFPELKEGAKSTAPQIRARAEREAINAPIQGTAADIIKIAMIQLPTVLQQNDLTARLLLQVHDELVLECDQAELDQTVRIVQEVMQQAYTLRIPLKTDAKAGLNWDEMEPH